MESSIPAANPFVLMTDPEAVFAAIERSERLSRLKSTVCRPLDKPRPEPQGQARETQDFDKAIEVEVSEPSDFGVL